MEVIYGLIPGMVILGLIGVIVLFWAARSGQFDDLEGYANRILMDDDAPIEPKKMASGSEDKDSDSSKNTND